MAVFHIIFLLKEIRALKNYFEIPLAKAYEIYRKAYNKVSGLSRTVRGPSMSALPGKISIEGIAEIRGEKVFVLTLLQARNPDWCKRPFFAKFDPKATWLDQLKPAFGEKQFFYQDELNEIITSQNGQIFFGDDVEEDTMQDSEMVA